MKLRVVVTEIAQETPHVKRFCLTPVEAGQLPPYAGGAHITTYLQRKTDVLERHYSLIGDPRDRSHYQIAVRLHDQSRGGSAFWHHQIHTGDLLEISYPKNHFSLSTRAKHHVLCAAGIGITPFLSMMHDLAGQSFELHMAALSQEECPFYRHIQQHYPTRSHFYFSRDYQRMTPDFLAEQRMGTHVYICGPEQMVEQFAEAARSYGYPAGNIHTELFTPPVDIEAKPFAIELAKSNCTLTVKEHENVLDVLLQAGFKVPYSCRVGRCGTCQLAVLEGEGTHSDSPNTILPCVSRAKTERLLLSL